VLVISDLHCPWEHPKALQHLLAVQNKYKCDRVVGIGDEIDQHTFSTKWVADPDLPSPSHELEMAIESLQKFYRHFPDVELVTSNHGIRIFKRARVSGLPSAVIRRYEEIMKFPKGWHMNRDGFDIEGVHYFHGEGLNHGTWKNAHQKLKMSAVFGHLHANGGVVYSQSKKKRYFALNTGCLINTTARAFDYGRLYLDKPTIGCGVVIDGEIAIFEPMPTKWL
jgi:hypothetical protein